MFGTKVEFSGLADRVDLLPVAPNPRGGRMSSWKILAYLWNALSDPFP